MKNNVKTCFAAAMLALGSFVVASAAQAQQLKLAVFDPQVVYAQSSAAKRAGDQLRSKQEQANDQIQGLEKPLVDKQKQIASQQSLLSPDKLKTEQDDLRKEYMDYRVQAAKISQDFEKAQFDARKNIADAMRTVVTDIAKEKGYDLVLPKGMALYTGANVPDISNDVLARVNAKLK